MTKPNKIPHFEQQDDPSSWNRRPSLGRQFAKKRKRRMERRRAKIDPDCTPCYSKFRGWSL